jgi:hypothetical protein
MFHCQPQAGQIPSKTNAELTLRGLAREHLNPCSLVSKHGWFFGSLRFATLR